MNPVIQRELREQSRTPGLFRLRLVAAGVLLATLAWGFAHPPDSGARMFGMVGGSTSRGSQIFLQLHRALALTLLAFAPALTADAIARERREATLGLLGLTPLTPLSVALGKSAANALKALTLWLAPLPILTVPILMGGVSGLEIATVVTFQMMLLALGLAAGLVASADATQFRRALALAYLYEGLFVTGTLAFAFLLYLVLWGIIGDSDTRNLLGASGWILRDPGIIFGNPFASGYSTTLPEVLATLKTSTQGRPLPFWAAGLGTMVATAILIVFLALRRVASRTARALKEEPPRPGLERLQRRLTTPVLFPSWIRRQQNRRLTRNPLLWLQHRTVAAALTRWGWLTVVIVIWLAGLTDLEFSLGSSAVPMFLLGGMVFSAAGGFRTERENGTLELLLVTPLTPGQLLQSRSLAHLREFVPPVVLQLFLVAYAQGAFRRAGVDWTGWNWWLIASLLTMPWIGLWRGLHARNFVTAVVSTATWGLLVPLLLSLVVKAFLNPRFFETPLSAGTSGVSFFIATRLDWGLLPALIQGLVALGASAVVWRDLRSRQFALGAAHRA